MSFSLSHEQNQSPDTVTNNDLSAADGVWKVLIVDDERDVHAVTKLVLSNFELNDRPLQFYHAFSADEAFHILRQHDDIAVALVDVVMETTKAGLHLVERIRNELENNKLRIILRTGQPGDAPEEAIIRDYDINDYKNKVDLTAIKLTTLMYSSIRSYRDICIIEDSCSGLTRLIRASADFLEAESLQQFSSTILAQLALVMGLEDSAIYCCAAIKKPSTKNPGLKVIAATGSEHVPLQQTAFSLPDNVRTLLKKALREKKSIKEDDYFVGYFVTSSGLENLLYVSKTHILHSHEHQILEHFANNLALAHDNLSLRQLLTESQRELSYLLGEAVERRSQETGSHVKRVAHFSYLLAIKYGVLEYEAETIRMASPLHDLGKIAIPDAILNKPGRLDQDEWQIMKTHAEKGYEILAGNNNQILQMGALIAGQHHEKWDGSGYPRALKGEEIHICGRITALADVFDALASERCYKPAWPMTKVIEFLKDQRGKHFEPKLVDILLDNIDAFLRIRDEFPEQAEHHGNSVH